MIQLYGRKKCAITRKAERFLKERRIEFQYVDLDKKAPGRRELELFAHAVGEDGLIDPGSKAYSARGLAYLEFDPVEEIVEHPELLRTPVLRNGRDVAIGDDPGSWSLLLGDGGA